MADTYGPPRPPTSERGWNEMRRSIIVTIPKSLKNVEGGLRKMHARRRHT